MSLVFQQGGMGSYENPGREEIYSFHVILTSDADEMHNLWLPKIPEGYFCFSEYPEHRFLSISAVNGQWIAACKVPAFFADVPLDQSYELPLADGLMVQIDRGGKYYTLYSELVSRQQMMFRNYHVPVDAKITIGSHPGCDICYDSPLISRNQATLYYTSGRWKLQGFGDKCGVYVNGKRRDSCILRLGDVVYIMGLRMIAGSGFLSITEGTGSVKINQAVLQDLTLNVKGYSRYYTEDIKKPVEVFYNRAPRKRIAWAPEPIVVEGPPMSMDQKNVPFLLRMGSSMMMGGMSALAGNFTTLISSVVFPFLNSRFSENQIQEYEQLRLRKYMEYLEAKRKEIEKACVSEQMHLNQKYPEIRCVIEHAREGTHLWERRPIDNDFLQLRLGTGTQALTTTIDYPKRRFELEPDELMEKMYQLVESSHEVRNAPVILSLLDTSVCGISGDRELTLELVRQMILQLAVMHSYDEVKMVFLVNQQEADALEDVRYLPHVWDNQRTIRFVATNEAEAYTVGEYIKEQTLDTEARDIRKILKTRPYYVIFVLDKKLLECHEGFKEILQSDNNMGVSIVSAHEELPKEVQKLITLELRYRNVCTTMSADGGDDIAFEMDDYDPADGKTVMSILANTTLKTVARDQELPKMVTFLEMLKTGRVEQLNSLKRWQENNPVKSLAAPVGIAADGMPMMLDLHEKRQGPHGLVAGMTGSGKSEFIITYILSMAVNYHPDEVAFVLIDYKGGGLAGAFENSQTGVKLPHLVGTITNLDGASIQRSLLSIESELLRRQKIFNEVKSEVNEGTMDIYAYQKLYRAGRVSKPLPHLFIISDEFAELKQQQPEFMSKLISAARIGRSLGIHLILATQKPSGVVDDQIRSNTKFRVCLRVQERSDSMDMLKRPEAAELTDTGRFYLQVGYNEYFALGQSAWCGAPYEPHDMVQVQRDDALEFLDMTGQVVAKGKPKVKRVDSGMKQIVAVVQYLSELAKSHGIKARQLWEPALPKQLDLEKLQQHYSNSGAEIRIALGRMDDPVKLRQFPYELDFETCGNILITGESGSGKTTMVQNILYLLARKLPPSELNFYVLDYSSRMLKMFKTLPHCGAVLQEEDEGSLGELFKLINGLVAERKRLFSKLEVDSFAKARKKQQIPLVLVVIDNFSGLSASKTGEAHTYKMQQYLKDSANYGVKFILTCSHLNEVSSRIRQELSERICFYLADKYSYQEALGCRSTYIPPQLPGRGLVKHEDRALEFQGGIIGLGEVDASLDMPIKHLAAALRKQYGIQENAQRLTVYNVEQEYEEFALQFKRGRIPLGFSKSNQKPVALPLKQFSILGVYFGNSSGVVPIMNNLLHAVTREQMRIWVIMRTENSLFDAESERTISLEDGTDVEYLLCSRDNLRLLQRALMGTMCEREAKFRDYCRVNQIEISEDNVDEQMPSVLSQCTEPMLLLIESMADFCDSLNAVSSLSYEKIFQKLRRHNIFLIGCFEPNIPENISNNLLFSLFQKAELLLFGGNFDRQSLYPWSSGASTGSNLPFNAALMQYRKQIYALTMPCGKLEETVVDEDEESIF